MKQNSIYSHTWAGIFWFDLPIALALTILFNSLIRTELIDHLPTFLNRRFSDFRYNTRSLTTMRDFLVVIFSLVIGITSHLCWDKLTHRSVRLLDEEMELYNAYWELNSAIGAAIIASVVWKMRKGSVTKSKHVLLFWFIILMISLIVLFVRYLSTRSIRSLGTAAISGSFIGLILVSAILKFRKRENYE